MRHIPHCCIRHIRLFALAVLVLLSTQQTWALSYGRIALSFYDAPRSRTIDCMVFYPAVDDTPGSAWLGNNALPVFLFAGAKRVPAISYKAYSAALISTAVMVVVGTTADTTIDDQTLADDMLSARQFMLMTAAQSTSIFYNHITSDVYCAGHSIGGAAAIIAARSLTQTTGVSLQGLFCMAPSASALSIAAVRDVKVRTLFLAGTYDCVSPTTANTKVLYDSSGAPCKTLVNMIGGTHCKFVYLDTVCTKSETGCRSSSIPTNGQEYFSTEYLHFFMYNGVSRPYSQPLTTLESFFSIQSTRPSLESVRILATKDHACEGDTITYSVNQALSSYYWLPDGVTAPTYTVIARAGQKVELVMPDPCYNWSIAAPTIIAQAETIQHVSQPVVCEGNPVEIGISNPQAYVSFQWSTGETTPLISVTKAGWYTVRAVDGRVCKTAVDSFLVRYATPERCTLSKRVNATPCEQQAMVTIFHVYGGHTDFSNYSVLWSTGDTTWTLTLNKDGQYALWFVATERSTGCKLLSDSINVTVKTIGNQTPTISRVGKILHCSPATYYQWMLDGVQISGATDQDYTVLKSGRYSVYCIYDEVYQCSATSSVVDFVLDVADDPASQWLVWQSDNAVHIHSDKLMSGLKIVNAVGQCVWRTESASADEIISTASLSTGVYFIVADVPRRTHVVVVR